MPTQKRQACFLALSPQAEQCLPGGSSRRRPFVGTEATEHMAFCLWSSTACPPSTLSNGSQDPAFQPAIQPNHQEEGTKMGDTHSPEFMAKPELHQRAAFSSQCWTRCKGGSLRRVHSWELQLAPAPMQGLPGLFPWKGRGDNTCLEEHLSDLAGSSQQLLVGHL